MEPHLDDDNINSDPGIAWDYIAWGRRVSRQFVARVLEMGEGFEWSLSKINYLMACMAFESAETFRPDIRNSAGSGATGLIQFMPSTAKSLGTSTTALAAMTAEQQLDYVEDYFAPYADRIRNLSDMYMAILYPKYVGTPDSTVLFNRGTIAYRQNAGLDEDQNGFITKAECTAFVRTKLAKGLSEGNVLIVQNQFDL